MASAELLRSEVVSSLAWVGRASAMACRMRSGLRGSEAMVCVVTCFRVALRRNLWFLQYLMLVWFGLVKQRRKVGRFDWGRSYRG